MCELVNGGQGVCVCVCVGEYGTNHGKVNVVKVSLLLFAGNR